MTVFNSTPGGGTSNALAFTIINPVPTSAGLSPASTSAEEDVVHAHGQRQRVCQWFCGAVEKIGRAARQHLRICNPVDCGNTGR